ncbi:MAG: TrmH family RNA methyltransferase [SAR324 cluster bacterium]
MTDEQTVYGMKAALALLERRPEAVLRIHYRADRRAQLKGVLAWAASRRLPYRELDEDSLRKVAGGMHHEGLVVVAKPLCFAEFAPAVIGPTAFAPAARPRNRRDPRRGGPQIGDGGSGASRERSAAAPGSQTIRAMDLVWLALDGVENPHNLGAILRSAAFFGAGGVLVGGVAPGTPVNPAAIRTAEGGAEYVCVAAAADLAATLSAQPANGWRVLGLETDGAPFPRERPTAPILLVLGHEHEGLRPAIRQACSAVYRISGEGTLASLNVSVAAGVALALLSAVR